VSEAASSGRPPKPGVGCRFESCRPCSSRVVVNRLDNGLAHRPEVKAASRARTWSRIFVRESRSGALLLVLLLLFLTRRAGLLVLISLLLSRRAGVHVVLVSPAPTGARSHRRRRRRRGLLRGRRRGGLNGRRCGRRRRRWWWRRPRLEPGFSRRPSGLMGCGRLCPTARG